jgi:hypothetical protein
MGVGIFRQLEHLVALLGFGATAKGGVMPIGTAATNLSNYLKGGFTVFLAYEGVKDFTEGGIQASLDEILAGVLTWTAGLGWGVGFYLLAKGFQTITGEDLGTWIGNKIKELQDKISEQANYFPDDLLRPTKTFDFLEGTLAGEGLDWVYDMGGKVKEAWADVFPKREEGGFLVDWMEGKQKKNMDQLYENLVAADDAIYGVKQRLDDIPARQEKVIVFKAKYEGFKGSTTGFEDNEFSGSLTD